MERVCFTLALNPERVAEYLEAHEQIWPEMLDAMRDAGWHNYSLFVREQDGLVVGYLEAEDFAASSRAMGRLEVNTRWQAIMAEYFASGGGRLQEYFHLE